MYDRLLYLTIQDNSEAIPKKSHVPKLPGVCTNQIDSTNSFNSSHLSGRLRRRPNPVQTGPHEMWDYKMLVTDEVKQLLDLNQNRLDKKRNLFKSSLDFM